MNASTLAVPVPTALLRARATDTTPWPNEEGILASGYATLEQEFLALLTDERETVVSAYVNWFLDVFPLQRALKCTLTVPPADPDAVLVDPQARLETCLMEFTQAVHRHVGSPVPLFASLERAGQPHFEVLIGPPSPFPRKYVEGCQVLGRDPTDELCRLLRQDWRRIAGLPPTNKYAARIESLAKVGGLRYACKSIRRDALTWHLGDWQPASSSLATTPTRSRSRLRSPGRPARERELALALCTFRAPWPLVQEFIKKRRFSLRTWRRVSGSPEPRQRDKAGRYIRVDLPRRD